MNLTGKTVNLNNVTVGLDLLAQFKTQARKEGWNEDEINTVVEEASKGDYDHQIAVLFEHSNIDEFEPDEYEFDEDEEDDFAVNADYN